MCVCACVCVCTCVCCFLLFLSSWISTEMSWHFFWDSQLHHYLIGEHDTALFRIKIRWKCFRILGHVYIYIYIYIYIYECMCVCMRDDFHLSLLMIGICRSGWRLSVHSFQMPFAKTYIHLFSSYSSLYWKSNHFLHLALSSKSRAVSENRTVEQ